jgi:uncharacterized membrane protein YgaE (UPF0421/DUF939 family)
LLDLFKEDPRDNNSLIGEPALDPFPDILMVLEEFFAQIDDTVKKTSSSSSSMKAALFGKKEEDKESLENRLMRQRSTTREIAYQNDSRHIRRYW